MENPCHSESQAVMHEIRSCLCPGPRVWHPHVPSYWGTGGLGWFKHVDSLRICFLGCQGDIFVSDYSDVQNLLPSCSYAPEFWQSMQWHRPGNQTKKVSGLLKMQKASIQSFCLGLKPFNCTRRTALFWVLYLSSHRFIYIHYAYIM